jgi:hypothetical protein
MSDSNLVGLAYIKETTWGQTPAGPPTLQNLRFVSESLGQNTNSIASGEIVNDRQISDLIRVGISGIGDINFELSYGTYDEYFAAALLDSAWSTLVTDTQITFSMANADNSINDSASGFVAAGFLANQWIKVSGFTGDTSNNGWYKIVSVAAGKMVLSHGTVVDDAEGESVTIDMHPYIENGVSLTSFAIEKTVINSAASPVTYYMMHNGMAPNTFNLAIAADAIVTGSFGFLGKIADADTSTQGDGSNTAVTTTSVMNAIDNVKAVFENGASYDITGFNLAMTNNLRARLQVATLGAVSLGKGSIGLTGGIQAYFENITHYNKHLDFIASSVVLRFEDAAGNGYILDLPRLKYGSGNPVAGGQNQDVIMDLGFTAYKNATESKSIRIVRAPA